MQETETDNNGVMNLVKEEIEQFEGIASLVRENSKEIEQMVYSIDGLNQMVVEIRGLLENQ